MLHKRIFESGELKRQEIPIKTAEGEKVFKTSGERRGKGWYQRGSRTLKEKREEGQGSELEKPVVESGNEETRAKIKDAGLEVQV